MTATRSSHGKFTVTAKVSNSDYDAVVGHIKFNSDNKILFFPNPNVVNLSLNALKELSEIMERIDAHPEITVIEV